jgi:hypothetical protein
MHDRTNPARPQRPVRSPAHRLARQASEPQRKKIAKRTQERRPRSELPNEPEHPYIDQTARTISRSFSQENKDLA